MEVIASATVCNQLESTVIASASALRDNALHVAEAVGAHDLAIKRFEVVPALLRPRVLRDIVGVPSCPS